MIGKTAFYVPASCPIGLGEAWVQVRLLEEDEREGDFERRLNMVAGARLTGARKGRLLLLEAELHALIDQVGQLERLKPYADNAERAGLLRARLNASLHRVFVEKEVNTDCWSEELGVCRSGSTWTMGEWLDALRLVYPNAQSLCSGQQLASVFTVRRAPTPFRPHGERGRSMRIERTTAAFESALRWGSARAQVYTQFALLELERLRDARFIRPSLTDADAAIRVRAASCLGFLAGPEDLPRLERLALKDPDRAVREAAVWAMSLSRGLANGQLDHLRQP